MVEGFKTNEGNDYGDKKRAAHLSGLKYILLYVKLTN